MTIQEKIDALKKEFETKIAELEKQAKAEEKQNKVWKPKNDEVYWYLDDEGFSLDRWADLGQDKTRLLRGNVFKTEEEAEWEKQHRIVATELKHFVQENDTRPITEEDWKHNSMKYYIIHNYDNNLVDICSTFSHRAANQVYASNEEVLQKAIKHIGEERLKKYYFGVKK